jgi:hypothetical protein
VKGLRKAARGGPQPVSSIVAVAKDCPLPRYAIRSMRSAIASYSAASDSKASTAGRSENDLAICR